jgi:hypothetical protein
MSSAKPHSKWSDRSLLPVIIVSAYIPPSPSAERRLFTRYSHGLFCAGRVMLFALMLIPVLATYMLRRTPRV